MSRFIMLLGIIALLGACESKEPETPTTAAQGTTAPAVVADPVVTEEIPEDLSNEAAKEVTAENADEVAAQLEAEIEAESK